MADETPKVEEAAVPERKLVRIRLKKKVVESPNKVKVTVNGERFEFSSDTDTEAPDFVLPHLGTEYELVDEKGVVLPPEPPKVEPEVELGKDGKPKSTRRSR